MKSIPSIKQLHTLLASLLLLLVGCDVHEFPHEDEVVPLRLQLRYETALPIWVHYCETRGFLNISTKSVDPLDGIEGSYNYIKNTLTGGQMRYTIRAYPATKSRTVQEYTKEFVFYRNIVDGYDTTFPLDLPEGTYDIMVWADLLDESQPTAPFYNEEDFGEIILGTPHIGNTDYRDAFRGRDTITLVADILEKAPDTYTILMQRPLAKYEFISNDLQEFIDREVQAAITRGEIEAPADGTPPTKSIDLSEYRIKFYYQGFMPSAYSMFDDYPVDSRTGVVFEAPITRLSNTEASLGFDYVFVGSNTTVSVQIGIYNKAGEQVSLTLLTEVPLRRSRHTLMKGSFLMQETSGGVAINPDFDGEHNIVIP